MASTFYSPTTATVTNITGTTATVDTTDITDTANGSSVYCRYCWPNDFTSDATTTANVDMSKYLYEPMTTDVTTSITNDWRSAWNMPVRVTPNIYSGYVTIETGWARNKKNEFLEKIRNNLSICVKSRADDLRNLPKNEQVAIESLREEISESEYRKYMKYGFILVKGQSGKVYQIFRNKWHTKVWRGGILVEEVCVRIKSNQNVPPTDNVLAFMTMIQANEEEFRKLGNVYKMAA